MGTFKSYVAPISLTLCWFFLSSPLPAQGSEDQFGDLLDIYFTNEVAEIESRWQSFPETRLEWQSRRPELQRQLKEMLGLDPAPPRGDLRVRITGTHERDGVVVENIAFQSIPGLYVTANLYRPAGTEGRLPAVLYVCGHATVEEDGVAYGSKVRYQHHPIWFARHGYVSLILDTLQLGEIEGLHHGTHREGQWWWINRGYTPAGVEAWNAIRAIDYLQSRQDVDPDKIAMTGRSGGGATTWWAAALDDRIQVAVPVAGITDLHSHVVDGLIERHCDCMYFINKYRWSFSTLATMVAPRPLLVENSDKDSIFPLDGVLRTFWDLRDVYEKLYDAPESLALTITPGPHKDTQELRVPAFHWMNHWLKGVDELIERPATSLFTPRELKVFETIPADELNTRIAEVFVPRYEPEPPPATDEAWDRLREVWIRELREGPFAGWPSGKGPLHTRQTGEGEAGGRKALTFSFDSQEYLPLSLWVLPARDPAASKDLIFVPLDGDQFEAPSGNREGGVDVPVSGDRLADCGAGETCVFFAPRGVLPGRWDPAEITHIRRRFALLGQTVDGMRVWDIRRALQALEQIPETTGRTVTIRARGEMAVLAAYASIWEPAVGELDLSSPPSTHRNGPILPFVSKILEVPQAIGLLLPGKRLVLKASNPSDWTWLRELAGNLGADFRLE